ncbi:MAG: S16 family serine protease [Candidatus Binatia bacterium]
MIIFDEIDKLGADFRGDPASAMLEVLDPEQNNTFQDHYLDVPVDLSKVLFITTANMLEPIPGPRRMEVAELAGYTDRDKLQIARRHLIPKQTAENGISAEQIAFTDEGLLFLIHHYTREAGLRNVEREIGAICKVARALTEGSTDVVVATPEKVRELLGRALLLRVAERTDEPGVSVGLVWTPMGGDIIFVSDEDVRQERHHRHRQPRRRDEGVRPGSARPHPLACARLGIPADFFENMDIHIHVPAGAVPKDGPSAGVTIATALTSLLTGRPVRHDVAMTGEITLRGKVLPVGGIKEKVLGATAPASAP